MTTAIAPHLVPIEGKGLVQVFETDSPNIFRVPSARDPNRRYSVWFREGTWTCNCEARVPCYHITASRHVYESRTTPAVEAASQILKEARVSDYISIEQEQFLAQAKLYAAFAKAQSEVAPAMRSAAGQVPGKKDYKYANLADIEEAIGPALANNGLAILQFPGEYRDGCQHIKNIVVHKDGGSIEVEMSIPCKGDAWGVGSGLSYGYRYARAGIMRVITEDDDGKGAMPDTGSNSNQRNSPAPRPAHERSMPLKEAPDVFPRNIASGGGTSNLGVVRSLIHASHSGVCASTPAVYVSDFYVVIFL